MIIFIRNFFVFLFILAGLFAANFVFATESSPAQPPSIVISEIAWMGSEVNRIESKNWWRYEWIELYNNTEQSISIDNWKIELYRDKLDWTLGLEGEIKPKNYFLIVASDKITNYDLNYSNLTGKFVNKGQKILLKNEQNKIIDEINCSSGWFYGDNKTKQTMERIDANLSGNNPQNWQTSQNPGGTPKSKNSIITESQSSSLTQSPTETKNEAEEKIKKETKKEASVNQKAENGNKSQRSSDFVAAETKTKYPLSSILIAAITAIFSGAIIFLLKNKVK